MTSTKSAKRELLPDRSGGEEIKLPAIELESGLEHAAAHIAKLGAGALLIITEGGGYRSPSHLSIRDQRSRRAA